MTSVDEVTKEITVLENMRDLTVSRPPAAVLEEARKAALALQEVISKKKNPVKFNGEQYLEFEDFQTIGRFYGLTCLTRDAELVEMGDIKGFKAYAEILDVKSGQIVGRAHAYCMKDEPNWKTKPLFQLASMAQTRAGAKAFRSILSWVVVLAGYKPTPEEEMDRETISEVVSHKPPIPPPIIPKLISDPQRKRFYAICKANKKEDEEIKQYLQDEYGLGHTSEITTDIYDELCQWGANMK